ncbi:MULTISPECIES: DUF6400 family protein [unclassified Streptomyces]|uniref:DUF6400 family protein n=1 Tax=unclassified Streptomyces TaxID=2593676 RepID=UPI00070EE7CF|nr:MULTISPECIES: DUF6400 family protein [unclassified Streptomyces]KRD23455.1 hypothetical protein ASE41_10890 [Streptomyces sp. Root264]
MSSHDPAPATGPDESAPVDFTVNHSAHETLRRTNVLAALGPDWDPGAALRDEEAAHDLLYSDLSPEQQRVYDELVAAGVLRRTGTDPA